MSARLLLPGWILRWIAVLAVTIVNVPHAGAAWQSSTRSQESEEKSHEKANHDRMRLALGEIAEAHAKRPLVLGLRVRHANVTALDREPEELAPLEAWRLWRDLGMVELREDNAEKGIEHLERAFELLKGVDFVLAVEAGEVPRMAAARVYQENLTKLQLGVAYLRLGEIENCCQRYNAESCIFPIQGEGLHVERRGSVGAIRCFTEVLENRPERMSLKETIECQLPAKWLMNIAYMTLGEYPDKVPEEYLVDLDAFEIDFDFPRFKNIGPELGLDTLGLSGGVVLDDLTNDGYLDIVTSSWDRQGEMRFFVNQGDGTFEDHTESAGLRGFFGGLNMIQADYDNDGDVDVFVLRGAWLRRRGQHPNSLLRNNGDATFTDVTHAAGLAAASYPTKTGAWADYDLDGDLDLFIGNESSTNFRAPCQLFQNQGDGTFIDVAGEAGVAGEFFCMGSSWGDFDADGDPDLYVSVGSPNPVMVIPGGGPNRLYRNDGDGTFTEVGEKLGVVEPVAGFPCWFWDFNNDGNLDLYAACSSGPVAVLASKKVRIGRNRLYSGDGSGGFDEVALEVGLDYPSQPMGANFGDLDGDGYLDFYLGTGNVPYSELRPNLMFLNRRDKGFANVTMAGGFGHLQKGHGVAFGDIDNDGDNDLYAQMGGAWPGDKFNDALFENPGFKNHWLTVHLQGNRSNRSAIGARVHIQIEEGGETRSIYRWINSGGSFGCNPLRQTIGLGEAEKISSLEIQWPGQGAQVFSDVPMDCTLLFVEGSEEPRRVELNKFKLGG